MKNQILIASNNSHKIEELQKILTNTSYSIITAKNINIVLPEVEEDKDTYEENSEKKALEYSEITGYPCLADDSGLEVEALNGEPGIYSARWSGVEGENRQQANNKKLLMLLKDIPEQKRRAKFVCVISLAYKEKIVISARGECYGSITFAEQGNHGFGYDPLFLIKEHNKTFAELGEDIKNKISHRAVALAKFKCLLGELHL